MYGNASEMKAFPSIQHETVPYLPEFVTAANLNDIHMLPLPVSPLSESNEMVMGLSAVGQDEAKASHSSLVISGRL
jgi:hypothetical protein